MRKGYKITLGILTIMILVTITIGTSYSYFSVGGVQEGDNVVNTTCFRVTYDDTNSSAINLSTAHPLSDTEGLALNPYTFTLTNTCATGSGNTKYALTINTLTTTPSTLSPTYLKYSLTKAGVAGAATQFPTTEYNLNPNVKTNQSIDKSYLLDSGELAPGQSITFSLRLWMRDVDVTCVDGVCTPNDVMGKTFNGRVLVYTYM